jgi:hypothetical protein
MIDAIKNISENGLDVNVKIDIKTAAIFAASLAAGIILGNVIAKKL